MAPDPAAFRARTLAKLAGTAPEPARHDDATALGRKRNRNTVRNGQRRKAITPWGWKKCLKAFGGRCAYCGAAGVTLEKEHFLPLGLGGDLRATNIVPSCLKDNRAKHDTHPLLWLMDTYGYIAGMGMWQTITAYLATAR